MTYFNSCYLKTVWDDLWCPKWFSELYFLNTCSVTAVLLAAVYWDRRNVTWKGRMFLFLFCFVFFFFLCLPSDFLFHQCGTCCIGSHTVCCVLDQEWFLIILLMSEFCMYPDLWKVLNLPTSARSRIAHMCMIWNMFPWSLFLSNWAATSRCNIELVAKFTDKMECGNLNSVNFKA